MERGPLCLVPLRVSALSVLVCEQKLDTIYCPTGIIQIDSVLYGRTQANLCNTAGTVFQNLNCRSTQVSTNAVKTNCQGRTTCLLQAANTALQEDPCPGQGKYLQVQYRCVASIINNPVTTTKQPTTSRRTTVGVPITKSPILPTGVVPIGVGGITSRPGVVSTGRVPVPGSLAGNISSRAVQLCHENLISGSRGVPDSQLSASSQLALANNVHRARLYIGIDKKSPTFSLEGGWTADPSDKQPWIQVKMNWLTIVQGIVTQGRHVNPDTNCCLQWVTRYKVHYSIDGSSWETVTDKTGNIKIFVGNTDSDTVITQMFDCPVTARFIKIEVVNYSGAASMRLDVIGCPTNSGDIGVCPKGWKERPNTGKCYYISDQRDTKTWEEGQLMCKRHQGDIVKIDDIQEKSEVGKGKCDIGVCPKGWKERPNTGKCYYISDQRDTKTWEEGQLMCKRHQGDIVKIDDIQEKSEVGKGKCDIGVCPKGWKERPNTGKCYYISDQRDTKTWEEGQLMCKRHQGDIVKIDDIQEKIWLRNELLQLQVTQNLENWWIGLNNRPRFDNSYYKWDDGTPFKSTAVQWNPGEPNNSGGVEHCAHYSLISDALNDRSCDLRLPFICEIGKYWTQPINVPGVATAKPTQPTTKKPATVIPNKVPVPIGGGGNVVSTGANIFSTGCLKPSDCAGKAWDDYPSCDGCHYFLTCAPNGNFRRTCPLNLKFDANLKLCSGRSSTCTGP